VNIKILKTQLEHIQVLRDLFLAEGKFQFTYDKCHLYGWADEYVFTLDDEPIGYGCVWGTDKRENRDSIFEFYLKEPYRGSSGLIFEKFKTLTNVSHIESQTNDFLLTSLLFQYGKNICSESILFRDHAMTNHFIDGVTFRKRRETDQMEGDDSGYVLEQDGHLVASGGLMLNYNFPYADIYMQVKEPYRQRGLGSLMVQELKNEAYAIGRVPAARCNISNHISKATLLKAGFTICGFRVRAEL